MEREHWEHGMLGERKRLLAQSLEQLHLLTFRAAVCFESDNFSEFSDLMNEMELLSNGVRACFDCVQQLQFS